MRSLKLVLCGTLVATTLGCASAAQPMAMVPDAPVVTRHHIGSLFVQISGGKKTNPMGASQVSNEDFATAVVAALTQHEVFSSVISGPPPTGVDEQAYRLDVSILDLAQPAAAFNMRVTLTTTWRLTRMADGAVVYSEPIEGSYTAKAGEAFAGVTRLRLANEGAARDAIQQGVARISELDLEAL